MKEEGKKYSVNTGQEEEKHIVYKENPQNI
jgi:hypothetical protein